LVFAFVDESGDPGTGGRGSRWLAIACAIVPDAERKTEVEALLQEVANRAAGGRPLHFTRMSHDNKRAAYSRLNTAEWLGIIALSDTTKPLPRRLLNPSDHYNDVLTEVLRRILWRAQELDEVPDVFIDRREGRFDLNLFKAHLAEINTDEDPYTDWTRLDLERIRTAEPADEWCLCLADGLAHAAHKALEPNSWAGPELTYLELCRQRLWRRDRSGGRYGLPEAAPLIGNGLVLMPAAEVWELIREHRWLLQWTNI
jgi:hypothetical protein